MHLEIDGMDDVMKKLEKLSDKGKVDEIAKKAVNAALPALTGSVQSHIHPRDVAGGVASSAARVNAYGVLGLVKVTGRNKKGESHAKRASILEYGRHDGRGGHKPWRAASASAAKSSCESTMKQIVEAEMELE